VTAGGKINNPRCEAPKEPNLKALAVLLGWDSEVGDEIAPVDLKTLGQRVGEAIVRGTQRRRRRTPARR
jgi:hypothetical protein